MQHIPTDFSHKYMDKPSERVRLVGYSNKWWPVNLKCHNKKLNLSKGWAKFVKENNLQVGNFCLFELIERENYVFKVSVTRGINDVDSK